MISQTSINRDLLRRLLLLCLSGSLAFVAFGCQRGDKEDAKADEVEAREQVVPVEIDRAKQGAVRQTILSTANVEARHKTVLVAEAAGIVEKLEVEEGDKVKAKQHLLTIRAPELRIALNTASGNVSRLRREISNLKPLVEKGYVARQGFEELKGQLDQATDQLARTRHQVSTLKARSPIDGIVARRSVQNGQQVTPGAELFYIVDTKQLEAVVHIPERSLSQVREGAEAYVVSDALGGARFAGSVRLINPVVDPQTGTIKVTLDLSERPVDSNAGSHIKLRPGMFVSVHLVVAERESAVLVPKRAVVYEDNQAYIYSVVKSGESLMARKLPVQLGFSEGLEVEVTRGVVADQEIIVVGQSGLKDETAVKPVEASATSQ